LLVKQIIYSKVLHTSPLSTTMQVIIQLTAAKYNTARKLQSDAVPGILTSLDQEHNNTYM